MRTFTILFLSVLCCYTKFALCDVVEQEGKRCKVACVLPSRIKTVIEPLNVIFPSLVNSVDDMERRCCESCFCKLEMKFYSLDKTITLKGVVLMYLQLNGKCKRDRFWLASFHLNFLGHFVR